MNTPVLLIDHNAGRCNERRCEWASAGVEVIRASNERQAAEALTCNRVDVICIDAQFVMSFGSGIGTLIKGLKPIVPIVLIVDEGQAPRHFQKYVDIVIDRADFGITGNLLIKQLARGQVTFFQRWFGDWINRAYESRRDDAIPTC